MTGDEARAKLRATLDAGGAIIGAGAGTGLSAKCAEQGGTDVASTQQSLLERDRIDSGRATAPLTMAEGAVHIDGTHLTLDEVIARIVELAGPVRDLP